MIPGATGWSNLTGKQKSIGKRIEECCEGGEHKVSNELSYALKAAQHVQSGDYGFVKAYRNGKLRLELHLNSIDYELGRKIGKNLPIAYGFSGLIGPNDATVCYDKLPDKRS